MRGQDPEGVNMDWDDFLPLVITLAVACALAVVAAFVLALKAVFDAGRVSVQLAALSERFGALDGRQLQLAEQFARLAQPPAEAAPSVEPAAAAMPEPEPAPEEEAATASGAADAAPRPPAPPEPVAAPAAIAPGRSWEQVLVEHWLVWLGGATIALGGAFLVKLSIDYGLLTPPVRVVLAILLGFALSIGAEWVRRRESLDETAPDASPAFVSYVPQALAAAGAATVFASLYAAYALYDLLPAGPAFALLAATAAATVAQSLRQGPLVAAVGLVGAYVVPALVESDAPNAAALFVYLAVVTAASLAVLRHRAWWWLAWLSLGGAVGWVVLWLGSAQDAAAPIVAIYLLVQFGLFAAFRLGVPRIAFLAGVADHPTVRVVVRVAFWLMAAVFVGTAYADRSGLPTIAAAVLLAIGILAFAWRDSELDDVIAVAGALALALLASWTLPMPTTEMNLWVFKVEADRIGDFSLASVVFAVLLGGGGFVLLPQVARPGRWAALSAAAPLLIIVIAYWRLQKFELDIAWSLAALALAGVELGAAAAVAKRRDGAFEIEVALAAYAVGVLGSTIFAATLALGGAWLTVALALHLPAMGWIDGRIRLKALRWLALGVAAIVLIRLVLNPYLLDYPLGPTPLFNWLLYGYGIPAAAFIVATRQFGSRADDALVWVLEAGSAAFALLLLSFELTHAIYGELTLAPVEDFAAGAALIAAWSVFGGVLAALGDRRARPVLLWGGVLVLGWATVVAALWQPITLLFRTRVGDLLILDALLLADAVPAVVYAAIAWQSPTRPLVRTIARILAAAFAFIWITLEIRHAFQGKVELFADSSDAEWYAYSVAWLAFAGAGLAAGLWWRNQWLRRAGLIGVGLVIAKVFLSDMAELEGVLRALSFLGLGGALVGIGYAYRRFRPLQQT
jgi:uncharacterized membrane protein